MIWACLFSNDKQFKTIYMDGFLLDVDTSKMREADNYFKSMITNAEKLQSVLKSSLGDPKAFAAVEILDRVNNFMSKINNTKLSPEADTKKLENLTKVLSDVVGLTQTIAHMDGAAFFNTQRISSMTGNYFELNKALSQVRAELASIEKAGTLNESRAVTFQAPKRADGTQYGETSKRFQNAKAEFEATKAQKEAELEADKQLLRQQLEARRLYWQEVEAMLLKELKFSKMTQDEKVQYVKQSLAKLDAEERKNVNAQRSRYRTLLSEQIDIANKLAKAEKYNVGDEQSKKAIDEYKRQFEIRDSERRAIEVDYANFVVDLTENAQRKMLDAELRRIKEAQEAAKAKAKEEEQAYLTSPKGALEAANKATTLNQMKDAQKYLQEARGNVDVNDKATIDQLNEAYTRLRATIENLTTAEKNENALQPTLRNEYARLLVEVDKITDAKKRLEKTSDYKSAKKQTDPTKLTQAEVKALEAEEALKKRLIDVETKMASIEKAAQPNLQRRLELEKELAEWTQTRIELGKQAGGKDISEARNGGGSQTAKDYLFAEEQVKNIQAELDAVNRQESAIDEVKRKHEADRARESVALTERTEAKKAEIAKRKAREAYEAYKKEGVLSSAKAERLIGLTDNAKNAAQAEKAIRSLELAKKRLFVNDPFYQATINKLNQAIERHKKTIEATANSQANATRISAQDALNNAKNAKTLQDLRKALTDLKAAREGLNISTDATQIKNINAAIASVNKQIATLEGKQKEVNKNNNALMNTFHNLKSVAVSWFSIQAITGYINKLVAVRKELERQKKSLEIILQSKDEADKLWNQTTELALKSPFQVKELITYTKQLAAYRIETSMLHDTTKRLADVSAGLGVDMSRLILAYGQVRAAEYLRGTELRQFTEAGIPMLDELAKYFSELEQRAISTGDVFDMISKRLVTFNDVSAVFKRMTDDGGVFYEMQEKQSKTLFGLISNLHDSIDLMLNDIGQSHDGAMKGFVATAKSIVDNWRDVAYALTIGLPLFALYKTGVSLMDSYSKASGKSARVNLWWNKVTKAKIGLTLAEIKSMTLAEAKIMGLTTKQFLAAKATMFLQTALRGLWAFLSPAAPFLIIATISALIAKFTAASRAAAELKENINNIISEDTANLDKSIERYTDLASRLDTLNVGSLERKEIISKLNSEYGEFLSFTVTELSTTKQLADAYEDVVKRMKERAALQSFDSGMEEIQKKYNSNLADAKEDFYELFKKRVYKTGEASWSGFIPTKEEVDAIYKIVQQKAKDASADSITGWAKQQKFLNEILSQYYGKDDLRLSMKWDKEIELLNILVDKKKEESELQEEIDAQYGAHMKSQQASNELARVKAEYDVKRKKNAEEIAFSEYERLKLLQQINDEEQLKIIDIKLKFGEISQEEADRLKAKIKNWESDLTIAINAELNEELTVGKELKQLQTELDAVGKEMTGMFNGNVDLVNRKLIPALKLAEKGWKDVGDGVATVFSSSYGVTDDKGKEVEILVTPILPDGTVLSEEELTKYIDENLKGASDILKADTKGIVIGVGVSPEAGEQLHQTQESYYNLKKEALSAEEMLSKVLMNRDKQANKSMTEYLKDIKTNWETQKGIVDEYISLKSAGVAIDEDSLQKARKLEEMYRQAGNALGVEIEKQESMNEATRVAVNNLIEKENLHISIEQAYEGTSSILSDVKKKETDLKTVIQQLYEQKKNGLPIDEERLRIAEEEYQITKDTLDLLDFEAKTPIDETRAAQINSKLAADYQLNAIDLGTDEVTLLRDANTEREKAIAWQTQLLAMQKQGLTVTKDEKDAAALAVQQWTLRWKLLGGTETKKTNTEDVLGKQLKVVDDMSKKYEELSKKFSKNDAIQGAFEAYKDAFADAYKDVEWVDEGIKEMSPETFVKEVLNFPDKNNIVAFLDKLAKEPEKLADKIRVNLAKGKYVYEMKLDAKVESDEDLKKKVDDMFADYDLSREVAKFNLHPDDAKKMFGLDTMSLKELRKQLKLMRYKFVGTDQVKEYEEYLRKISEMEDKERTEQMKKYAEYLSKSMTERVKIKKEELYELSKLEQFALSEEQKSIIRQNIQKESQEKMDKLNWDEFKDSEFYIRVFQDVDAASTRTLKNMRSRLVEMKSLLKNLDPADAKALADEIEKIESTLAKRNPFKTAITGIDDYIKAVKKTKEIEEEYLKGKRTEKNLQSEERLVSNFLAAEEAKLDEMNESGDATEEDVKKQKQKIQQLQQQLLLLQKQLQAQKDINEANGQAVQQNEDTKKKFKESLKDVGAQISSAASALPQVAANLENVFGAMDAGTKDTVESISEIGGGIGSAISGFASGDYIQGIMGVTQAIAGIFNVGDKKKERAIQRELKRVEELQKEYEKLDEKIQSMYNIDEININYDAMKKNLNEQIASTEKMIQLEEDKKKTDHARIAEYKEQIEEYQKQLEELEDARIRQLGGIAGDDDYLTASQNFVDAWLDAFRETGDGLSGLEEQFDEVYMNLVKKQILGRGVDKMLEPLWDNLKLMLDDGAMSKDDYSKFSEQWNALAPNLNEFLTQMVNDLGIVDEITQNAGSLSGLQEGISGITEDQADILAAYWSSVRFIVSNIEQKFTAYADQMLGANSEDNPIVIALKAQTAILEEIRDALSSVITTGSTVSGARLKMLM